MLLALSMVFSYQHFMVFSTIFIVHILNMELFGYTKARLYDMVVSNCYCFKFEFPIGRDGLCFYRRLPHKFSDLELTTLYKIHFSSIVSICTLIYTTTI